MPALSSIVVSDVCWLLLFYWLSLFSLLYHFCKYLINFTMWFGDDSESRRRSMSMGGKKMGKF